MAGIGNDEVLRMLPQMPTGTLGTDFTSGVKGFRHFTEPPARDGELSTFPPRHSWPGVCMAVHPTRGLICLAKQPISKGTILGALTGECVSSETFHH